MAVRSGGVPIKTPTAKGLESLSRMIAEGAINVVPSPAGVAAENIQVVDSTGISNLNVTEEGVFHVTMTSGDVEAVPSTQPQVTNPVIINQGDTSMNAPVNTTTTSSTTEVVGNISAAQAPAAPVAPAAAPTEAPAAQQPLSSEVTSEMSALARLFGDESAWKEDAQSSLEVPVQVKNIRGRMNLIEDVVFDHEKRLNALEKAKTTTGGRLTVEREKSWEDVAYMAGSTMVVGASAVTGVYFATKALNAIFGSEPATE